MSSLESSAPTDLTAPTPAISSVPSAWDPLPSTAWTAAAARHLLRRAAWTAELSEVDRAVEEGLPKTLDRLFPATPLPFPKPKLIEAIEKDQREFAQKLRAADEIAKRQLRKELRDRFQQSYQEMVIKWLQFAADPAVAATEKWVLCLSDIYVVAYEKVRNTGLLYQHQATLRQNAFGSAPTLTKAVSRSPAMIDYLDLKESKKDAPNENFARELFELFVLGEGNYTETEIKEAARAFTGYRQRLGHHVFVRSQHDSADKKIFGKTGNFDGDAIIDLAYGQPAARTFLPKELLRFYLSDLPIEQDRLTELGDWWKSTHYNLRSLLHQVFGSKLFYAASYQGNYIKSPIQFYLGLVQDLGLEVSPLARQVVGALRQMGQMPFNPPNVRGWVGGRSWINSATLGARRQLVHNLFNPINEATLNADDEIELVAARAEGRHEFTFPTDRLRVYQSVSAPDAAERLVQSFLPLTGKSAYTETIAKFIENKNSVEPSLERLRTALMTLLQTPDYQLC